jgi:glycosyltransferase involved in cell wall biosynthesis
MRVAIIHYWLLRMRGGEKVVELLCRLLPEADLFTLFYDPARISPAIRSHRVTASFLNPFRRGYRALLPLMPLALEHFDLRGYDLILSSESGPAKGVLAPSTAHHICYCHTPMRYLWDLYPAYVHDWARHTWQRAAMAPLAGYLRLWDYASAARVDEFIANSHNVSRRIWKTYRRESQVVHPGVPVETFYSKPSADYHLIVSELVAYKRIDTAVRLFSKTGRRLRIAGEGPEYRHLKRLARRNIEFCGHVADQELRELYAHCGALLMPGEEDFGITAVEALASGKPVVALGRGGALETVPTSDLIGGVFYSEPDEEQLAAAIAALDRTQARVRPAELQAFAARFSESEFLRKMHDVLAPWITAGSTAPVPR